MDASHRILTIAGLIEHDTLADIGTDHAYIPIAAALNGTVRKAAACDMNRHSVEKARRNIAARGLSHAIDVRLGNGLAPVLPGEFQTVVIAGLGGPLIKDILAAGRAVALEASQLILSPQTDVSATRRFVHELGFAITDERLLLDDGKFYNVLVCHKGTEPAYTDDEYALGRRLLEQRDALFLTYIEKERETLRTIARRIENGSEAEASRARLSEVSRVIALYDAILHK